MSHTRTLILTFACIMGIIILENLLYLFRCVIFVFFPTSVCVCLLCLLIFNKFYETKLYCQFTHSVYYEQYLLTCEVNKRKNSVTVTMQTLIDLTITVKETMKNNIVFVLATPF